MIQYTNGTAMRLAWNFFKGNYALNFAVLGIFILLNLLGMVPIIGLLAVFGYSILSLSLQIYFGRKILEIREPEEMALVSANTKIGDLLVRYLPQASGAFLALFLLTLLYFFLLGLIIVLVAGGTDMAEMAQPERGMEAMESMGSLMAHSPFLITLLIGLIFLYPFPAVMGRVIESEDFVDGFKSIFYLFSPTLWKGTFSWDYFSLITLWSLILLVGGFVIVLLFTTLFLLPIGLILAYLMTLYNGAIYLFAKEIALP
ncbi:MAG: hypothetical protein GXO19_02555, partial [Epsilonproteobacteria bacterium]|nr:hypothetical protein [Campylobacterota bacterium]NPA56599.1 hypothetical protein [Campylobacterota bacterium]